MALGKTILVIDDEPAIRLLCRVNLELEGYVVLEAASVDEARTCLAEDEVDAVLLDANLGRESGVDLLRELRASDVTTPVAFLTGDTRLTEEELSHADGVLAKPFELDALAATVERLLGTPDPQLR